MVTKGRTEEIILHAARRVFQQKGMAGSRMQEIADEAGINKALLHYYYRNKEKLFLAIYQEAFELLIPKFNALLKEDLPIFDKIRKLVKGYSDFLIQNPYLPAFIIYEMNANPERFIDQLKQSGCLPQPAPFIAQIQQSVNEGIIRKTDPRQLIIHIISLCVFPFAARPMIQGIALLNETSFEKFAIKRQSEVAEFIINALKP